MKILIVSYYFAPQNKIAAVRTTKIAKYLKRIGHEVEIICSTVNDSYVDPILVGDIELIGPNNIYRISDHLLLRSINRRLHKNVSHSSTPSKSLQGKSSGKTAKKRVAKLFPNSASVYLEIINSILWYRKAKSITNRLDIDSYDVILSSYGPLASPLLAHYIKIKSKRAKWISDYRDPIVQDIYHGLIRIYYKIKQYQFLRCSDASICVSEGMKKYLRRFDKDAAIFVITNGYDPEDARWCKKNSLPMQSENKLIFSYCGALYQGKRDLSPLFCALSNLTGKNLINLGNIVLYYAGNEYQLLYDMAKNYGVEGILVDCGKVARDVSLTITYNSDIALIASWNDNSAQGVLTGKLFEILMLRKMIAAFISGNRANSELKKIIENINAGYAYEEANPDQQQIERVVMSAYKTKMKGINPIIVYNDEEVKKYDYSVIVGQLSEIIGQIGK